MANPEAKGFEMSTRTKKADSFRFPKLSHFKIQTENFVGVCACAFECVCGCLCVSVGNRKGDIVTVMMTVDGRYFRGHLAR